MGVRILIADDHDMVRRGLGCALRQIPDWEVCGEAGDGREAVALAEKLRPDIVIMDMQMPNLNGLDATRQIRKILPATEVLIFTGSEREGTIREVFRSGARSYLLKTETSNHLVPAIEALCKRRTYFSSKVSEIVFAGYLTGDPGSSEAMLTPRERELVQLVAEGKSNKDVSGTLGISVKTVETHRAAVMRKLALESIADLVRYAIRNGITTA